MSNELKAVFESHRMQILLNCQDPSGDLKLPEGFLYSVAAGIYPIFDESWCVGEQDPFSDCYRVGKEFVDQLVTHLDKKWLEKAVPTFYQLEGEFGGRAKRVELIQVLRYCFLSDKFDPDFYDTVLTASEHPVEANGINRPFSNDDISIL